TDSSDSTTHAVAYANSGNIDLGTLGGDNSEAYGVNNFGDIVGYAKDGSGAKHAFIYQNGVMQDLNSLITLGSGWVLTSAEAINDRGQIVGYGTSPSGQMHGFLVTLTNPTW